MIKDKRISSPSKLALIYDFDDVFGLNLKYYKRSKSIIPEDIRKLAAQREILRTNKQFIQADALRKKIEKLGYRIEDGADGPLIING